MFFLLIALHLSILTAFRSSLCCSHRPRVNMEKKQHFHKSIEKKLYRFPYFFNKLVRFIALCDLKGKKIQRCVKFIKFIVLIITSDWINTELK